LASRGSFTQDPNGGDSLFPVANFSDRKHQETSDERALINAIESLGDPSGFPDGIVSTETYNLSFQTLQQESSESPKMAQP